MAKVIVFGNGTIGKRVITQLPVYGHQPVAVVTRKGIMRPDGSMIIALDRDMLSSDIADEAERLCMQFRIEHALLAIPSGGDGFAEAIYINSLVSNGLSVVTAGKSALANRFDHIMHSVDRLRFDAALGGGTMIPSIIRRFLDIRHGRPFTITMIINGTLNYAQSRVDEGATPEQIADEALRLGFAEPMPSGLVPTPYELYAAELSDIQRKLAITCNLCLPGLAGHVVNQHHFTMTGLTEEAVRKLMAGNASYRYMVRVCTREDAIGYFAESLDAARVDVRFGDLCVVGGFIRIDGALRKFIPPHAGNAIRIEQGGDCDVKIGQGAGPVPTVGAMMANLSELAEAA